MRTRLLISVIATAAISAVVFGVLNVGAQINPGPSATPERCTPPAGKGLRLTVTSNTEARVWVRETVRDNIVTRKYFACSNAFRRHIYLATTKHQDLVDEGDTPPFSALSYGEQALSASAAAFVKTTCDPAGENAECNYVLRWLRLKDGKVIRTVRASGDERPTLPVIRDDAVAFYIVDTDHSTGPECGTAPCEVRMMGVAGDKTIDTGSRITPLVLQHDILHWINGEDARAYQYSSDPPRFYE